MQPGRAWRRSREALATAHGAVSREGNARPPWSPRADGLADTRWVCSAARRAPGGHGAQRTPFLAAISARHPSSPCSGRPAGVCRARKLRRRSAPVASAFRCGACRACPWPWPGMRLHRRERPRQPGQGSAHGRPTPPITAALAGCHRVHGPTSGCGTRRSGPGPRAQGAAGGKAATRGGVYARPTPQQPLAGRRGGWLT